MDITASIVSHGHGDQVLQLLAQLSQVADAPRRVIVTFNVPEPRLQAKVESRGWPFDLLLTANAAPRGFGANHNAAFRLDRAHGASGAFALLNPDIRLHGSPFAALAACLARSGRVGCAYPRQLDARGAWQDHERLLPTVARLLVRLAGRRHELNRNQAPDWVNAAFLLVRHEAFASIGGFDERFYMYCEDVDFCLRMRLAGWRLQRVDAAVVEHIAGRASHRSPRHLAWHVASLLRLWRTPAFRHFAGRRRRR